MKEKKSICSEITKGYRDMVLRNKTIKETKRPTKTAKTLIFLLNFSTIPRVLFNLIPQLLQ